jgi:hypothetical protein
MSLDVDVVIDADARLAPLGVAEALGRQGPKGRPVEAEKEIPAGLPGVALHRAGVQLVEQCANLRVQRRQREKGLMAHARKDPALRDLDGHFDFGLCLEASPVVPAKSPCRSAPPTLRTFAGGPVRTGRRP